MPLAKPPLRWSNLAGKRQSIRNRLVTGSPTVTPGAPHPNRCGRAPLTIAARNSVAPDGRRTDESFEPFSQLRRVRIRHRLSLLREQQGSRDEAGRHRHSPMGTARSDRRPGCVVDATVGSPVSRRSRRPSGCRALPMRHQARAGRASRGCGSHRRASTPMWRRPCLCA